MKDFVNTNLRDHKYHEELKEELISLQKLDRWLIEKIRVVKRDNERARAIKAAKAENK